MNRMTRIWIFVLSAVSAVACAGEGDGEDSRVLAEKMVDQELVGLLVDPNAVDFSFSLVVPKDSGVVTGGAGRGYWQRRYHCQVGPRLFLLMGYPYYPGGESYPCMQLGNDIASLSDSSSLSSMSEGTLYEAFGIQLSGGPDRGLSSIRMDLEEPCAGDSYGPLRETKVNVDADQFRYKMERYSDLLYQWRSMNESPGAALEVLLGVELTRTSTEIYTVQSQTAVQVKRVIGQIRRTNRNFDGLSRLFAGRLLATDEPTFFDAGKVLARMEKLLAELGSLFTRLAEYDDQIGVALGMGRIDRDIPLDEPIRFSNLQVADEGPVRK